MKLRIVKTGRNEQGGWYYRVERKYWIGWFVTGGSELSVGDQLLTLEQANDVINELIEFKGGAIVVKEVISL